MPTPKSNRKGQEPEKSEKNRKKTLTGKSSSFHGRLPVDVPESRMRRPNTSPNLLAVKNNSAGALPEAKPKLTKLLLNVTIQGSVGAVQVLISPESTVGDLIAATIQLHTKERRRPILPADPSRFDLHYSQFSLEHLAREEKLAALGSRNFFLCPKRTVTDDTLGGSGGLATTSSPSSCSKEAETASKGGFTWLKFMDFLG
ncbi:hypothetical protein K2173_020789 [Erythroxylum novogranatense]|uniref:DUF7054 domain-containing protein n=1 Tax=Erythroxylum novogranatense TaxID=1862640 RepID=A0AAV8TPL5_9ROSI|nr:hypothetical protein K2173_020789 [Erythroxylum novogranatense]